VTHTNGHPDVPTPQYVAIFNCQHANWGHTKTSPDGESLDIWAKANNLGLLYDPNRAASFECRKGQPTPGRRVVGTFPRPQHRPSLIAPPRLKVPANSDPVNVGTFARPIGSAFAFLQVIPLRDCHLRTHQILRGHPGFLWEPCGCRKNNVLCWDKECETLYRSFQAPVGTDSDRAPSSLLSRLEQKKQERWEEAVNSIDFSHSSLKAWSTINKLTSRSGRSSCLCRPCQQIPSPHNSRKTGNTGPGAASPPGSPTRSCPTYGRPEENSISVPHRPEQLAAALRRLKPRKVSGSGFYLPGVYTPRWVGSQSWFCDFLTSCLRQLKFPKI